MRKVFLGFVITFIVFLTALLLTGIVRKVHNSELIAENIARFPAFSFMTLSNETFRFAGILRKGQCWLSIFIRNVNIAGMKFQKYLEVIFRNLSLVLFLFLLPILIL